MRKLELKQNIFLPARVISVFVKYYIKIYVNFVFFLFCFFELLQRHYYKMKIPQPTESHAITVGRTKTPPAAPTGQLHAPKSSRFDSHLTKFWRGEKVLSKRWVVWLLRISKRTIHRVVCVCVYVLGLGWGVGAGPNVFIAPMKRPENPNKSKTQTRTKATERGWSLLLRAPRFVCC